METVEFCLEYERIATDAPCDTAAIIVAAGSSTRMGGIPKQFIKLEGVPVIVRSLLAFENSPEIKSIIVVARDEDIPEIWRLCEEYCITKLSDITSGGDTRARSVQKGLDLCVDAEYVAIHDGARPLVSSKVISNACQGARIYGACAAAVAQKDTVKIVNENMDIISTPDRSMMYAVQTPQVFRTVDYKAAVEKLGERTDALTDDCAVMEAAGYRVHLSTGDYKNIKITTPEDIIIAEALVASEGI